MSDVKLPTVDREIAAQETDNWREYYAYNAYLATKYQGEVIDNTELQLLKENAFRGFRIPISDLLQITDIIKEYNAVPEHAEKINSVRVYLARPTADPAQNADVHVYLVPIVGGNPIANPLETIVRPDDNNNYGRDLLRLSNGAGTIYNFSTPCPKQCDTNSRLYSLTNPAELTKEL